MVNRRGPDQHKRTKIHEPTAESRLKVAELTGLLGYPRDEVAKFLRISVSTLVRRYRTELSQARTDANLRVASNLYSMACKPGNFKEAAYWAGTRMGWSEKAPEAAPIQINPGPDWQVLFKPKPLDLDP